MPIKITESPRFEVLRDRFPPQITPGGRLTIDQLGSRKALQSLHTSRCKGCYIFAVESYGNTTPWYIGKATKGFGQEVFTDRNCKIYAEALDIARRGKPVIYFVALPYRSRGPTNLKAVKRLEDLLIRDCGGQNPKLLNRQKVSIYKHVIVGVMNSGKGKPSRAAKVVRAMTGRT